MYNCELNHLCKNLDDFDMYQLIKHYSPHSKLIAVGVLKVGKRWGCYIITYNVFLETYILRSFKGKDSHNSSHVRIQKLSTFCVKKPEKIYFDFYVKLMEAGVDLLK